MNKTESRVILMWDLEKSSCLDGSQKLQVRKRLANRISEQGILWLASETHRSQYRNREEVTGRFLKMVQGALQPEKKRFPTRPGRASVEERIMKKKIRGELKRIRRWKPDEG